MKTASDNELSTIGNTKTLSASYNPSNTTDTLIRYSTGTNFGSIPRTGTTIKIPVRIDEYYDAGRINIDFEGYSFSTYIICTG